MHCAPRLRLIGATSITLDVTSRRRSTAIIEVPLQLPLLSRNELQRRKREERGITNAISVHGVYLLLERDVKLKSLFHLHRESRPTFYDLENFS